MNILIIGSAPSAETWVEKYKNHIEPFFGQIASINNAWYLVRDFKQDWYRPDEFLTGPKLGYKVPHEPEDVANITPIDYMHRWREPFHYNRNKGGTMILNVLYCLFNRHFTCGGANLYVVGCDADYSMKDTHFYGKPKMREETKRQIFKNAPDLEGKAADPLRFGRDWFIRECVNARDKIPNMPIVNLSEHHTTLLPFTRRSFNDVLTEPKE